MNKCCSTCQYWEDGTCINEESDMYQTGAKNSCPHWENYDYEMFGEEDTP